MAPQSESLRTYRFSFDASPKTNWVPWLVLLVRRITEHQLRTLIMLFFRLTHNRKQPRYLGFWIVRLTHHRQQILLVGAVSFGAAWKQLGPPMITRNLNDCCYKGGACRPERNPVRKYLNTLFFSLTHHRTRIGYLDWGFSFDASPR